MHGIPRMKWPFPFLLLEVQKPKGLAPERPAQGRARFYFSRGPPGCSSVPLFLCGESLERWLLVNSLLLLQPLPPINPNNDHIPPALSSGLFFKIKCTLPSLSKLGYGIWNKTMDDVRNAKRVINICKCKTKTNLWSGDSPKSSASNKLPSPKVRIVVYCG